MKALLYSYSNTDGEAPPSIHVGDSSSTSSHAAAVHRVRWQCAGACGEGDAGLPTWTLASGDRATDQVSAPEGGRRAARGGPSHRRGRLHQHTSKQEKSSGTGGRSCS